MNEEPQPTAKEASKGLRYSRAWVLLATATFVILLIVTQFLPGGRRSFSDWLPPLLFLAVVSVAVATVGLGIWLFGRWFCRWRTLKRVLLAGACLALLMVLFYAEEDWRGWHAWNQFRMEWEAKGEPPSPPTPSV